MLLRPEILNIPQSHGADINPTASSRRKNLLRKRAFYALYCHKELSVPALARELMISIPTAGRLMQSLEEEGLAVWVGEGPSQGGRKPRIYRIDGSTFYTLAVDLSRNSVRLALFSLEDRSLSAAHEIPVKISDSEEYIRNVQKAIENYLEGSGIAKKCIVGTGVSIPGLLNPESGESYTHFPSLSKPLPVLLSNLTGLPVMTDNDARLVALGESAFGSAKGKRNALCLLADEGVGLGIILNGQVYAGSHGFAGEFGHTRFTGGNTDKCYCGGEGCLETLTSLGALERLAKADPPNGKSASGPLQAEFLLKQAAEGDAFAVSLVEHLGQMLGSSLASAIHLFDPECIVLGGRMTLAGSIFEASVRNALIRNTMDRAGRELTIEMSRLGRSACLLGCHALVMKKLFTDLQQNTVSALSGKRTR